MEVKPILEKIVSENEDKADFYLRNLLKEYLQVLILEYIYSSPRYRDLFFYGGTCLAQCYGLPRLSEDLDFVDAGKKIDLDKLTKDLSDFFNSQTDLSVKAKTQKFRVYLKFPILNDLGLAGTRAENDNLNVKVEIFSGFDFCRKYREEFKPIFKFNRSVLVKTFDLPTLMATKIRAVLYRNWEKTNKKGETLIAVKGRDYFDLMWFLDRGIEPNLNCLEGINSLKELKESLGEKVRRIDTRSVVLDLENFLVDSAFAKETGKNIKKILQTKIENLKD